MIPESLDPLSYLLRSSVQKNEKRRTAVCTYMVAKKAAMTFKISASLFEVSSHPGVSMRVTAFPSRMNSFASWIPVVHGSGPAPIRRFEPLARLINWGQPGQILVIFNLQAYSAYRCFPTSSRAHDSVATVRIIFSTGEWIIGYTRDPDGWRILGWAGRPARAPMV